MSFPGKKSRNNDSGITSVDDENGNTDTDSDDFCPSLDPEATAALARAITDSEDESGGTPSLYTPMLSKEPSFSDGMFLKGLHRFLCPRDFWSGGILFYPRPSVRSHERVLVR